MRISVNDTAVVRARNNGCLEEAKGKGRADAREFRRRQSEHVGSGRRGREQRGVAARFQRQAHPEGWGPHQLAPDPGVVPNHRLPASGLS